MKALNLVNQQFGKLTVFVRNPTNTRQGQTRWDCNCECGNQITVASGNLTSGHTQSCGCLIADHCKTKLKTINSTHGLSHSDEYGIWVGIKDRCHNEGNKDYAKYGGRGIAVCNNWFNSFAIFYQDMGPRPSVKHSIERRNNDSGYNPDNCYWATKEEQANNRRTNVYYLIDGKNLTLPQIGKIYNLNPATIKRRIKQGSNLLDAVKPVERPMFTYDGETRSLASWAGILGFNYGRTKLRLQRGWSFEDAIRD